MINEIGRLYEPEERYILLVLYPSHQITLIPSLFFGFNRGLEIREKNFSLFFVVLRIEVVHVKCVLYH